MSDFNRRDTLKLASAAAALGAGLGALFQETDANAQPITGPQIKTDGLTQFKESIAQLKIDSAAQIKIDGYRQIKIDKGYVQLKLYSGAGQFLHAANVPEEIANLLTQGAMVQFKFFRPQMVGEKLTLAGEPFSQTTLAQIKQTTR